MTELFFIRHGGYVYDRVDERGPKLDLGLSATGRAEIEALGRRLENSREIQPSLILSSTERRALESACVVGEALGVPVDHDPDLEEWRSDDGTVDSEAFMAQWRGLTERQKPFHRFGDGCETGIEFSTRVHSALHRIVKRNEGKKVVLVTHGGFIQVAFQFFFGYGDAAFRRAYPVAANASVTHWRKEAGSERWALQSSNDVGHLRQGVD